MTKKEADELAIINKKFIGVRIKSISNYIEPVLQVIDVKSELIGLDNWETVLVFPFGVNMLDNSQHAPISIYELIGESPTYTVFK